MNIIITGAGRGIGYELVKVFARDNSNSLLAISRNPLHLEKLKNYCLASIPGSLVRTMSIDLNDLVSDSGKLAEKISGYFPHVDILINNAGLMLVQSFEKFSSREMHQVFNTNFFAPSILIQALLPLMGISGHSHIVNIGSMGGFQGSAKFPGLSVYSASKAALACLTECLAEELKDRNISVNCLALGSVQTEMLEEAFPGYKSKISSMEMAEYIASFAVHAMNIINGKVIPVSITTP
ncbi:MAG: SDR family NAD(P)-dependent oxidoreductase [Bacteroidia bacterium]|nr:SDR family NAD(P)-dependent oxidoreductase [Bacteroidia bacterium]